MHIGHGGLSETLIVPRVSAFKLPSHVSLEEGGKFDPMFPICKFLSERPGPG
jgi:hypothetical protein